MRVEVSNLVAAKFNFQAGLSLCVKANGMSYGNSGQKKKRAKERERQINRERNIALPF
jgi:hypothetical protein